MQLQKQVRVIPVSIILGGPLVILKIISIPRRPRLYIVKKKIDRRQC